MFDLEHCVDRFVASLSAVTAIVDAKLSRLRDVARDARDPANAPRALRKSDSYDRNDIIDCELVALVFHAR